MSRGEARGTGQDRDAVAPFSPALSWTLWLVGGFLVALPLHLPGWEHLVWIAPLPWFLAMQDPRPLFRKTWSGNVLYGGIGCVWLFHVGILPGAGSAVHFGTYGAVSCWVLWRCRIRLGAPFWVLAPVVWGGGEVLRMSGSAFPTTWVDLGYNLLPYVHLRQIADLTWVFGLGMLPVLASAVIAEAAGQCRRAGWVATRQPRVWLGGVVFLVALACAWGYGKWVLSVTRLEVGPTLALVQPAIPQELKNQPAKRADIIRRHGNLTVDSKVREADLVIWPESAASVLLNREASVLQYLGQVVSASGAPLLMGAQGEAPRSDGEMAPTNSAYLVDADARILAKWDKRILVPMAETLVWIDDIGFLRRLLGRWFHEYFAFYPFLLPGDHPVVARIPETDWLIGAGICYADVIPYVVRDLEVEGADVVAILSNEAWFGASELPQHLAMARVRAIESRVPLVRSTNTGITAFITPLGDLEATLPPNEPGVLLGQAQLSSRPAPPAWVPRWLSRILMLAMLFLAGLTFLPRYRRSREETEPLKGRTRSASA